MRIGIDIKAFKNGTTGISRYLRCLMDRLQEIDTRNDYLLYECTKSDYVVTNPRWKKVLIPWKLPGILWQQFILPGHLKRDRIDLLWAPEQISPVLYHGTVFATVHDLAALRFPESCQRLNLFNQKYLFPVTVKNAAKLLPVSDYIGRELLTVYPKRVTPDRVVIITNGSPEWKCRHVPERQSEEPFLFFAGNREPRKNLIRLIEALELLKTEGLTITLRIAGPPGWKNKDLHARISTSTVKEQIRFLGYLSEQQLMEQYHDCRAVVYPSVYEGFGLPGLEAFCMGTRVITSRGTVMEEIAGSTAAYFDPFDPRDIARTIRETMALPPPGTSEFAGFREVLDTYSWEKSARRLLELMETVGKTTV